MQEIIVYSTPACSYCQAAKRLLTQRQLPFREIDLGSDPALRQKLSDENNGYRTVPMIFIGKEFIGGYNELTALDRSGALTTKANG